MDWCKTAVSPSLVCVKSETIEGLNEMDHSPHRGDMYFSKRTEDSNKESLYEVIVHWSVEQGRKPCKWYNTYNNNNNNNNNNDNNNNNNNNDSNNNDNNNNNSNNNKNDDNNDNSNNDNENDNDMIMMIMIMITIIKIVIIIMIMIIIMIIIIAVGFGTRVTNHILYKVMNLISQTVQVMPWCCQPTGHGLGQCGPVCHVGVWRH